MSIQGGFLLPFCNLLTCVFMQYDVKTGTRNTCFPGCDFLDTATFRSPNALHDGHITYYCAYGAECSTEPGAERWVDGPAIPPPAPAPAPEAAALIERQGCVPSGSCTRPEGDGDPHQWILTKQLSAKKDCGDDNCAVQENEQINYKIRANTNGLDWISGGFDVQESVDAGFHNECVGGGNNPGRSVCVKAVFWHTDYTVRGGIANQCATDGCLEDKDTTIFRSPNQIRVRVEYYCAWDDDCADQGAESWAYAQEGPPPSPAPKRALDPAARDETLEYEPSHSSALEKRDDDCPIGKDCFGLWQNGAVKQMILHKQISDPYACAGFADDPGCPFDGKTKSWDAPIRYDGDKVKWSDLKNVIGAAGWPVEKSIKTGQPGKDGAAPDCAAKPGETVCLFADLWHTQFSTNYGQLASCDPYLCNANSDGFTQFVYEVTAPNALKGPNVNYVSFCLLCICSVHLGDQLTGCLYLGLRV